jgi:hypothetical protein
VGKSFSEQLFPNFRMEGREIGKSGLSIVTGAGLRILNAQSMNSRANSGQDEDRIQQFNQGREDG